MNSYVFLAAMFTTPAFGWVCDRTGRYAPMLAFGALLLPLSIAVMALTHWSLWVATAMIGVSFSLVPCRPVAAHEQACFSPHGSAPRSASCR